MLYALVIEPVSLPSCALKIRQHLAHISSFSNNFGTEEANSFIGLKDNKKFFHVENGKAYAR